MPKQLNFHLDPLPQDRTLPKDRTHSSVRLHASNAAVDPQQQHVGQLLINWCVKICETAINDLNALPPNRPEARAAEIGAYNTARFLAHRVAETCGFVLTIAGQSTDD